MLNPKPQPTDIAPAQRAVLEKMFGTDWPRAAVCGFQRDPSLDLRDGAWNVVFAESEANLRLRCRHNWNNYFVVSTFKVPKGGGTLRRERSQFGALYALMFDDVGTKIPDAFVRSRMGDPHVVTETSPGNFQWLYRLAEPVRNLPRAEMLVNGWVKTLKAHGYPDPGQSGVTRYARLPGMNTKAKYGPGDVLVTAQVTDWVDTGPLLDANEAAKAGEILDFPASDQDAEDAGLAPGGRGVHIAPLGTHKDDPTLQILEELGLIVGHQGGTSDKYDVTCPWVDEHTGGVDNGTFYGVGGGGAFKCHHGHCQDKDIDDFRVALDDMIVAQKGKRLRQREVKGEFEDLGEDADPGRDAWLAGRPGRVAAGTGTAGTSGTSGTSGIETWVDELNQRFAIIGTAAGMRVLERIENIIDLGVEWRFFTFAQFRERVADMPLLEPPKPKAGPKGPGRPASKGSPVGAAWLRSPRARRYDHAMVWPPGGLPCPANVYNMWQGYGVKAATGAPQGTTGAEWPLIREFLATVICGGDVASFDYLIRWIAWCVQHPGEPIGTAVVLQGLPATGKGTLGKLVGMLFDKHGLLTERGDDIVGRFNAILEDKLFVFADEALFAGDPRIAPRLRGMVTNPVLTIEGKGQAQRTIKNRLKLIVATNDLHALHIQVGDRRWLVLTPGTGTAHTIWVGWGDDGVADMSANERDRDAYFDRLNGVLTPGSGEMRAFMRDLMGLDLTGWRASHLPHTAAKGVQIALSLRGAERWLVDLASGSGPAPWGWMNQAGVDLSLSGTNEDWMDAMTLGGFASKHAVYDAYQAWAQGQPKDRYDVLNPTHFWRRVRTLLGVLSDPTARGPITSAPNGTGLVCRQLRNPTRELVGFPTRDEMNDTLAKRLRIG